MLLFKFILVYNKLCKLSESDHHRRLISYKRSRCIFYTLNEESVCILNNNKLCKKISDKIMGPDKVKTKK
jgi:hypothetical protein